MRPDQLARLTDLSERLADSFLDDADPVNWTAHGTLPCDMSPQDRGDSYWCKKNAMATGGVLRYTLDLMRNEGAGSASDAENNADMDRLIAGAEKRAATAVARVLDKAKKRTFDERAIGRR